MTYLDYQRLIIAFLLASIRVSVAFSICPALVEAMVPGLIRRVAILGFSLVAVPYVVNTMPPGEPNMWMLGLVAAKEVIVGLLIGFFSAIPFWVAENVGNLIDNQRGATMGEVYSPLSGAQVASTGIFFTLLVSTIFFVSGAVLVVLGALYHSYEIWPIFGDFVSFDAHAPRELLAQLDGMVRATVIIGAPVIILMLLATVGLGFVNRTAPQLNVFFLSMPVKSALGVAMLIIYLQFIMDQLMYTNERAILDPILKLLER